MVYAADFTGKTDDEIINNAIKSKDADATVVITPKKDNEPWVLDNSILLPENTTIIINNCKIKLSDKCRDNFFRSANCGAGIEDVKKIHNIHIKGIGNAVLEGADHPRSTGDSSKSLAVPSPHEKEDLIRLASWIPDERKESGSLEFQDTHMHTYGTDVNDNSQSQHGGWQNIGILLANVDNFSIENISMIDYHCWGISIEAGTNGRITNIHFEAYCSKMIDGMKQNIENQDGIDIRNGCNNIIISDITGHTGDDVIALTAIADNAFRKSGTVTSTHVLHSDWKNRDTDIHHITVRNVIATSENCWLVRLLPVNAKIYNVIINDLVDTAKTPTHWGAVLLGEGNDAAYGANTVDGMKNIIVSNVISNSLCEAVIIGGYLTNSVITNIVNANEDLNYSVRIDKKNGIKNVKFDNFM